MMELLVCMKFKKTINGVEVIKPLNKIVLKKNGKQTFNPSEEMVLEDGWVEYVAPTLTEEQLFNRAKSNKIRDIEHYDASKEVNICYIKTPLDIISYWANKSERSALKSAVQDCIAMNRETYRLDLRDVGVSVNIACDKLLTMLSALEVYAIDCYNKTTDHIFAIKNLTTVEEIEAYNYKVGYPEKLTFDL